MKLFWKIILILVIAGILGGSYVYFFMINKSAPDYVNCKADFKVKANDIIREFTDNYQLSQAKYDNKVVAVEGVIFDVTHDGKVRMNLVLENQVKGINCAIDTSYFKENKPRLNSLAIGNKIKIKGYYSGFDDLLQCVNLINCSLDN